MEEPLGSDGIMGKISDVLGDIIDINRSMVKEIKKVAGLAQKEGKVGKRKTLNAGIWRDLTDNVNQLAESLTTQVRTVKNVATAVTKGDLSQTIAVDGSGELASLKDKINEMIRNLPGSIGREHRYHAQYDASQHPDGEAAHPIAIAHRGAAEAAGGAAADERAAGGQSAAAAGAESGGGAKQRRSRACQTFA